MTNQYGEAGFNTEMPDLIFGESKEKKSNGAEAGVTVGILLLMLLGILICVISLLVKFIRLIFRKHSREEKICGFRNVLTMFFAIVAVAMIVCFEMYTFWLI